MLEAPDWACPNTCFDVNAEDVTTTVLDEFDVQPVSYTWSICNDVPQGTALPTIDQPSLLSGMATVCVDALTLCSTPCASGWRSWMRTDARTPWWSKWTSKLPSIGPNCSWQSQAVKHLRLTCDELGLALGEPQLFLEMP